MSIQDDLDAIKKHVENWRSAKKPSRLLEHHGHDDFEALFCPDPVIGSAITIRSVWVNGDPVFPSQAVPLLSWHPLVFAAMESQSIWNAIYAALDGFDAEQAWHWQDETTRWTYLTLHDPNPKDSEEFVPTNFVYRVFRGDDGAWTSSLESASWTYETRFGARKED